ncbi:MAG: FliH/SctL family protein [Candidatus Kapabacteria bacterium]|nr:FliH/SctL family protein [Candidatus Kapabacteria bacterium]
MAQIQVKIPKIVNTVRIIRSKDLIQTEVMKRRLAEERIQIQKFNEEQVKIREEYERLQEEERAAAEAAKIEKRVLFTEEFTISNVDKPIEISLKKIPEESLPLSIVQAEVQNAYDLGFKDGKEAMIGSFNQELEAFHTNIINFDSISEKLQKSYRESLRNFEESLGELAIIVAEHILGHEMHENSLEIVNQAKKAISTLNNDIIFKIRVHPDNVKILFDARAALVPEIDKADQIVISGDVSLEKNDCVIETSAGSIDARLQTQLNQIKYSINHSLALPSVQDEINFSGN